MENEFKLITFTLINTNWGLGDHLSTPRSGMTKKLQYLLDLQAGPIFLHNHVYVKCLMGAE